MKKIFYIIILFFLDFCSVYSQDTLLFNKNVFITNYNYLFDLSEINILKDDGFFKGYFIIEIDKELKIDTTYINEQNYILDLYTPVYWVADLDKIETKEKYYYTFLPEIVLNQANIDFSYGDCNRINSFFYFYKLFNIANKDSVSIYLNSISERKFADMISNKLLYEKDGLHYLIFSTSFSTAIFRNLKNNTKFFIPISHLYSFEYLNENLAEEYGFQKSNKLIISY